MSISVKWHKPWCTVRDMHLGKCSIIISLFAELIESIMYLYRATNDPFLLTAGVEIVESIERLTRTECGYATVKFFIMLTHTIAHILIASYI